jgi:LysR family transcriptional regulator, cys regulon transcriptional activator
MTLTQLRYFVAIVDAGLNITTAAQRVHATQPGLSKQLKLLEDQLGYLLFNRRGRSLESVTAAGANVLIHARRLLADNIRRYAANERIEQRGQFVLLTTPTQARYVLPNSIANLKAKHPGVSVHLQSNEKSQVLTNLNDGQADLAIISTSGQAPTNGLAIPLYRWNRVAVVPKHHALASAKGALGLDVLAAHPLVTYESTIRPDSSFQRSFAQSGYMPKIAITAQEVDLIKTYVRAGLGVGVLAEMAVSRALDADLKVLPLAPEIPECTCWAVLPRDRVLRTYVLDLLTDIAPQLDRIDIQRCLQSAIHYNAVTPPSWVELSQSITN